MNIRPIYNFKKIILSFFETKENGETFLMTRKFEDKTKAEQFVTKLLNGKRKVSNIEFKNIEEVRGEPDNAQID